MKVEQSSMTVIVPILPGKETFLETLLVEIGKHINDGPGIRFAEFPAIHFARWAIIPSSGPQSASNATKRTPRLIFATDHDGSDTQLLTEIVANTKALDTFDSIYQCCQGWPGVHEKKLVIRYFLENRVPYCARYIACPGRTVQDLKDAAAAHASMEAAVDTNLCPTRAKPCEELNASDAKRKLAFVRAAQPLPNLTPPPVNWQLPVAVVGAVVVTIGVLARLFRASRPAGLLGGAALVGLPAAFFAILRQHETADTKMWAESDPPSLEHLATLRTWEDHKVQNQMTHLVPVKPGEFRRQTLRGFLAVIDVLARFWFNRGNLGGIPSIHFARWMLIDSDQYLLFFSNYDGSWENYLGDFIDRASAGLTGIWSNTVDFPPTKDLINDGSRRADAFKNWTRRYQIETQVWYSAYPDVSVNNFVDAVTLCLNPPRGQEDELLKML